MKARLAVAGFMSTGIYLVVIAAQLTIVVERLHQRVSAMRRLRRSGE